MSHDIVFFDVETQRSFQEIGGRRNLARLGLAIAVVFSAKNQTYTVYHERDATDLVARLVRSSLVIGFNCIRFDFPVLKPYAGRRVEGIRTLDLMRELEMVLGHRVGLATIAQATLGEGKIADGLQSVRWYRQGRLDKVIEYCRVDVDLTRRIFEFGLSKGHISFFTRDGKRKSVPAPWALDKYRQIYAAG